MNMPRFTHEETHGRPKVPHPPRGADDARRRPGGALGPRVAAALIGIVLAVSIGACGGAIGSGGTGATPAAVNGGTVTGFGSVVVDGLTFDDRLIAKVTENEPGEDTAAEARMGHRVELEVDSDGKPKVLRVAAAVTGAVTSTSVTGPAAGSFVVLGQTITVNGDPTQGPVTQFGAGYANAMDIQSGHAIEVHGVLRTTLAGRVIQATRVEKLSTQPVTLRVSGLVSGLGDGGAGRFTLGSLVVDASAAALLPAGAALANDVPVVVFAPETALTTTTSGVPMLNASAVRIKSFGSAGAETVASGFVDQLDAARGLFHLNGQTVRFNPADVQPAGTMLAENQYVQVRGSVEALGVLLATSVKRRDGKSEPEAELKGSIVGFDSTNNTFLIRDVAVILGSTTELEGCPATGLRDGLFVELEGSLGPTGVVAKEVKCKDEPTGAVIEREGVAGNVDLASSSFTLTPSGKAPVKVRWTGLTFFRSVTPLTLGGKTVEVEGTLADGEITATKIKIDD